MQEYWALQMGELHFSNLISMLCPHMFFIISLNYERECWNSKKYTGIAYVNPSFWSGVHQWEKNIWLEHATTT